MRPVARPLIQSRPPLSVAAYSYVIGIAGPPCNTTPLGGLNNDLDMIDGLQMATRWTGRAGLPARRPTAIADS